MKKLIEKVIKIYNEYKMPILYIFFGGLTTLVNIVTYILFYNLLNFNNIISNIIAWILSVIFAYITNKIYVFESKNNSIIYEIITFLTCRLGTGVLDLGIMYITVDLIKLNGNIMKIISNVVVIILNYILSKLIIFKKTA